MVGSFVSGKYPTAPTWSKAQTYGVEPCRGKAEILTNCFLNVLPMRGTFLQVNAAV